MTKSQNIIKIDHGETNMNKMPLKAGEKAVEYGQSFHCSESALKAINDVF